MKFYLPIFAALAVSETNGMQSHIELVSRALTMGGNRENAQTLLKQALSSFATLGERDAEGKPQKKDVKLLDVPIDEKKTLQLKVSATYARDRVESVTLKAFRKIVGYDTFNSIRKKNLKETKDAADYYNVTLCTLVKRLPEPSAVSTHGLAASLDRGFPYDD